MRNKLWGALLIVVSCNIFAATTWVPIINSGITIVVPFIPSEEFEAPSNVSLAPGETQVLTWDEIEHASKYEIQGLNAQGEWVSILVTESTSLTLDSQFNEFTAIRVVACNYHSCVDTGSWSATVSLLKRGIIFIHTDLLGTPVAESDENGDVN